MRASNIPDDELAALIAADSPDAFRILFDRYHTALTLFALRFLGDEDAACDVVQTVFLTIYEQRGRLEIHTSLRSFLYQSVRNRCLNEIKSRKVRRLYFDAELAQSEPGSPAVEQAVEQSELEARLAQAVEQLPPQCRRVFELSRYDAVPNAEIAEQLNISKRTVETQISKALRHLRLALLDGEMCLAVALMISTALGG